MWRKLKRKKLQTTSSTNRMTLSIALHPPYFSAQNVQTGPFSLSKSGSFCTFRVRCLSKARAVWNRMDCHRKLSQDVCVLLHCSHCSASVKYRFVVLLHLDSMIAKSYSSAGRKEERSQVWRHNLYLNRQLPPPEADVTQHANDWSVESFTVMSKK